MWYFEERGQRVGPVPEAEIREAIVQGRVSRLTLMWRDGFQDWLPAAQTEFAGAFPPGPPPPLPSVRYASPASGGVHYAGFWIRAVASVMDTIIVQIVAYGLGYGIVTLMAQIALAGDEPMELSLVQSIMGLANVVWALAYYIGSQASRWQATPGKRIAGIHVVRTDGQRIGLGLAIGRSLALVLSALPVGIGFMMAGWTDQKKALHDMICGTRVVYGKA